MFNAYLIFVLQFFHLLYGLVFALPLILILLIGRLLQGVILVTYQQELCVLVIQILGLQGLPAKAAELV